MHSLIRVTVVFGMTAALSMAMPTSAPAQCAKKQVNAARKTLRNLSCIQADLPPGPAGPPGPQGPPGPGGPPGPSGLAALDFVDAGTFLLPLTSDCAAAECNPGDRIINCDSANLNPVANTIDANTVLITAIGLRDPEDDTPDDLLAADTCLVCYSNFNDVVTVEVLARAVCAVGAKGAAAATSGIPRRRPTASDLGALTRRVLERAGR